VRKIFALICFFVFAGSLQAQDSTNGVWNQFQTASVRFSLPAGWDWTSTDIAANPSENITVQIDHTCPTEETLDEWVDVAAENIAAESGTLLNRESLNLPLGDATRLAWEAADEDWRVSFFAIADDECLSLQATAPEETRVVDQIVHTISWLDVDVDGRWLLQADPNLVMTLRTPPSWQKLPVQNSLMVRETFDDVLVQVQYRDLGGTTNVAALQPQFDALYSERGYALVDVQTVNLPAGDALLYRLEGVTLGSRVQTQMHAILMRGNYLILATLGADENYFAEYEQTLLQMLDTLNFNEASIP